MDKDKGLSHSTAPTESEKLSLNSANSPIPLARNRCDSGYFSPASFNAATATLDLNNSFTFEVLHTSENTCMSARCDNTELEQKNLPLLSHKEIAKSAILSRRKGARSLSLCIPDTSVNQKPFVIDDDSSRDDEDQQSPQDDNSIESDNDVTNGMPVTRPIRETRRHSCSSLSTLQIFCSEFLLINENLKNYLIKRDKKPCSKHTYINNEYFFTDWVFKKCLSFTLNDIFAISKLFKQKYCIFIILPHKNIFKKLNILIYVI